MIHLKTSDLVDDVKAGCLKFFWFWLTLTLLILSGAALVICFPP